MSLAKNYSSLIFSTQFAKYESLDAQCTPSWKYESLRKSSHTSSLSNDAFNLDFQLLQQLDKAQFGLRLVDNQPHRALLGMRTDIDHTAIKTAITHIGHRNQQLARKIKIKTFHCVMMGLRAGMRK